MTDIPFDLRVYAGPNPFVMEEQAKSLIRDLGQMLLNEGAGAIHVAPQEMKDALLIALIVKELSRQGDLHV